MFKNIIANFAGRFWSILSNFLFIPLYIKYLGFEAYSVISFTLVITGLMAVLDSGLTSTLSREFARKDNTINDKKQVFSTLESIYLMIVFLVILIVFIFSGSIAENWIKVNVFKTNQIELFLKIISFDIGFQLLLRFYMGGLLGLEKQVTANMLQMFWGIFRNGLVVVLLLFIPVLTYFFIWQSVTTVLFALLFRFFLWKNIANTNIDSFKLKLSMEKDVLQRIWKFAGGMLLISLVAALNTQLDKLAISKLLSVSNLGYYTLAVSLSTAIIVMINPISTALLPRFTSYYSSGNSNKGYALFAQSNLVSSIITASFFGIIAFFSKEIIWIWTGNIGIANSVYKIVPIVALSYSFIAMQIIPYNIAIANGYTKLNNILGILSLVITLPGYYFFTSKFGVIGAASVFCFVQFLITMTYLFFINKKFLKTNIFVNIYLKHIILPLSISIIVVYLFSMIPVDLFKYRWLSLTWISFISIITFLVLVISLLKKETYLNFIKYKVFNKKK